jgi:NAD(P)-dependent dehydrogenase (short-subunit alcohol dehydrogenase family)
MAETHKLQASSLFSVKDYVCLVTGGGTGIGLMAAQALAANGTPALNSLARTYRN